MQREKVSDPLQEYDRNRESQKTSRDRQDQRNRQKNREEQSDSRPSSSSEAQVSRVRSGTFSFRQSRPHVFLMCDFSDACVFTVVPLLYH